MSTKTTFKRVALVAVAALGFGLLSGVAANATDTAVYVNLTGTTLGGSPASTSNTTAYPALAPTQISGITASVYQAIKLQISTSPDTGTIHGATNTSTVRFQSDALGTLGTSAVLTTQTETQTTVSFNAPGLAGTFAGHIIVNSGTTDVSSSAFTLTVGSASPFSTGLSTAFINKVGSAQDPAFSADEAVVFPQAIGNNAGTVKVILKNALGGAITGETVNASISGSGLIIVNSSSTVVPGNARVSSAAANGGTGLNEAYVHISSDGTAGTGTVTISVTDATTGATTTLATKTVIFTGAAATFAVTALHTNLKVGANGTDGDPLTAALAVKVTDANGNIVADGTSVYASSSGTETATVTAVRPTSAGYAYFAVQGVKAGTATITFGNAATSPTVTTTAVVTITGSVISTLALAFDKATYAPGEKMLLTVTAKDSTGAGVADGPYTIFTAAGLTTNVALQGFPVASAIVDLVAGVKTFTVYAPLSGTTVTVSATTSTETSLVAALQGVVLSASADITGDTSATDAANAATDAANYAADAADAATTAAEEATAAAVAAQDSADAAMAAVVALGLRVNVLYQATRTQVLRLQALLVRLIKKLHA